MQRADPAKTNEGWASPTRTRGEHHKRERSAGATKTKRRPGSHIMRLMNHGEYKVPGGKLVVVDLAVVDGHLRGVQVSGDFFLEPAEALDDINAALEGAPATASEEELARRIEERLAPGVEMIGFSPEAVAVAVRRALA